VHPAPVAGPATPMSCPPVGEHLEARSFTHPLGWREVHPAAPPAALTAAQQMEGGEEAGPSQQGGDAEQVSAGCSTLEAQLIHVG
jgi:hypothetical protein